MISHRFQTWVPQELREVSLRQMFPKEPRCQGRHRPPAEGRASKPAHGHFGAPCGKAQRFVWKKTAPWHDETNRTMVKNMMNQKVWIQSLWDFRAVFFLFNCSFRIDRIMLDLASWHKATLELSEAESSLKALAGKHRQCSRMNWYMEWYGSRCDGKVTQRSKCEHLNLSHFLDFLGDQVQLSHPKEFITMVSYFWGFLSHDADVFFVARMSGRCATDSLRRRWKSC